MTKLGQGVQSYGSLPCSIKKCLFKKREFDQIKTAAWCKKKMHPWCSGAVYTIYTHYKLTININHKSIQILVILFFPWNIAKLTYDQRNFHNLIDCYGFLRRRFSNFSGSPPSEPRPPPSVPRSTASISASNFSNRSPIALNPKILHNRFSRFIENPQNATKKSAKFLDCLIL